MSLGGPTLHSEENSMVMDYGLFTQNTLPLYIYLLIRVVAGTLRVSMLSKKSVASLTSSVACLG